VKEIPAEGDEGFEEPSGDFDAMENLEFEKGFDAGDGETWENVMFPVFGSPKGDPVDSSNGTSEEPHGDISALNGNAPVQNGEAPAQNDNASAAQPDVGSATPAAAPAVQPVTD